MVPNLDSIQINLNLDQANFCVDMQFIVTLTIFAFQDDILVPHRGFARHHFVFNLLFLET